MQNLKKKNKNDKKPKNLKPKICERNKLDLNPRAMGNKIYPNLPEPEIFELNIVRQMSSNEFK